MLNLSAAHLPAIETTVIDTGRGKRSAFVDLQRCGGRETPAGLVRGADVFIQGYRPGAIDAFGFDAEHVAACFAPGHGRRVGLGLVTPARGPGGAASFAGADGHRPSTPPKGGREPTRRAAGGPGTPRATRLRWRADWRCAGARDRGKGNWRPRCAVAHGTVAARDAGRFAAGVSTPDPFLADVADLLETSDMGFG